MSEIKVGDFVRLKRNPNDTTPHDWRAERQQRTSVVVAIYGDSPSATLALLDDNDPYRTWHQAVAGLTLVDSRVSRAEHDLTLQQLDRVLHDQARLQTRLDAAERARTEADMRWQKLVELMTWRERLIYWVRPYDMSLDARRWRWQTPGCWRSTEQGRRTVELITTHLAAEYVSDDPWAVEGAVWPPAPWGDNPEPPLIRASTDPNRRSHIITPVTPPPPKYPL